jgi:CubicO group peptidase (beta-lactamase class C family)
VHTRRRQTGPAHVLPLAVLLLAPLVACGPAPVAEVATAEPSAAAATAPAAPLAEVATATDAVFAAFHAGSTPGCAVGVHLDGEVVHEAGYGTADLEAGLPITPDTVFDVASVSKQITAGVVMALVVDGELALDDPVGAWLPDLDVSPATITVGDLVHHTSGLPDYIDLLDADYADVTTADDALAVLQGAEASGEPGTTFEYSNTNYFLLGQVVEAVTGQSLADVADERIFDPLGMDASRVRDDQGTLDPGQAVGYAEADGGWEPVLSAWRQTGDGAVHTTVGDLLRWASLFLEPPREAGVGSDGWLDLMRTPGPVPDEDGAGYGGGLVLLDIDGEPLLFHSGAWVGVSSYLLVQPADRLAVAVACNVDDLDAESLGDAVAAVWAAT